MQVQTFFWNIVWALTIKWFKKFKLLLYTFLYWNTLNTWCWSSEFSLNSLFASKNMILSQKCNTYLTKAGMSSSIALRIARPALYSTLFTLNQVGEKTSFDKIISSISLLTTFSSLKERHLFGLYSFWLRLKGFWYFIKNLCVWLQTSHTTYTNCPRRRWTIGHIMMRRYQVSMWIKNTYCRMTEDEKNYVHYLK